MPADLTGYSCHSLYRQIADADEQEYAVDGQVLV